LGLVGSELVAVQAWPDTISDAHDGARRGGC
jgi:hypothetical protein